ncbi:hypothetical protein SEVIR_8G048424v4 [Setaria viridis]|uniref:Uncharacterized protein n=1 Tax=Setaria viridis TaxID=4556 RepID=A0A4U6TDE2_SETVI|nr:hypothetical protein SEVIR_8G048424v2 [Setaria viridis]
MNFVWAKNFTSSSAMQYLQSDPSMQISLPPICPLTATPGCSTIHDTQQPTNRRDKAIVFEGEDSENIASSSVSPFMPAKLSNYSEESMMNHIPMVTETSPTTPLEKMIETVSYTKGPWSKSLLEHADQINNNQKEGMKAIISDEELRRSKRKIIHSKGFKDSGCRDSNCIGCSANPPHLSSTVIRNLGEAFCKIDASKLTCEALNKKKKVTAPLEARSKSRKRLPMQLMMMGICLRIQRRSPRNSKMGYRLTYFIMKVLHLLDWCFYTIPLLLLFGSVMNLYCSLPCSGSMFSFSSTDDAHLVLWSLNYTHQL